MLIEQLRYSDSDTIVLVSLTLHTRDLFSLSPPAFLEATGDQVSKSPSKLSPPAFWNRQVIK